MNITNKVSSSDVASSSHAATSQNVATCHIACCTDQTSCAKVTTVDVACGSDQTSCAHIAAGYVASYIDAGHVASKASVTSYRQITTNCSVVGPEVGITGDSDSGVAFVCACESSDKLLCRFLPYKGNVFLAAALANKTNIYCGCACLCPGQGQQRIFNNSISGINSCSGTTNCKVTCNSKVTVIGQVISQLSAGNGIVDQFRTTNDGCVGNLIIFNSGNSHFLISNYNYGQCIPLRMREYSIFSTAVRKPPGALTDL